MPRQDPGPPTDELPTLEPFIPASVGNFPDDEIANAKKERKHREAVTVEPRPFKKGIAIYIRVAYWKDHNRSKVLYIKSSDIDNVRQYEQAIRKWFNSKNRTKGVGEIALQRVGILSDGL